MLKEREAGERDFVLVDVREPNEYEINRIPGSVLIPKGEFLNGNALGDLPGDKQIVMHCKSGVRSAETLAIVKGAGLRRRRARRRWRGGLGVADRPQPAGVLTLHPTSEA